MELKEVEQEIVQIKSRNKKVELDKKWETSWTRKICIMIYLIWIWLLGLVERLDLVILCYIS